MVQVCSRCHRANPAEAVYCFFDGVPLTQGPAKETPAAPLPEFVFPSGRRCRTLEEFAEGCRDHWEEARDLLRRGILARYLTNARRPDLARDAEQAQAGADPDVALVEFLANLPAPSAGRAPRLGLDPRRIAIKAGLLAGDRKKLRVLVVNQGAGLLQGKLAITDNTPWLHFADAENDPALAIHTTQEQQVSITVDTHGLVGGQSYTARLTAITNGGIVELPIRIDLGASPFPHLPFRGAVNQHQLAKRMRDNPKAAVPLLDGGEVRRWFEANGWTYPVPGAAARGVGAVQQFFECLGLTRPPVVELSEREMTFDCRVPGVQTGQVTLRTSTPRKWVYGEATSTVPWVRVTTPAFGGTQKAVLSFEVDPTDLTGTRVYEGSIRVQANGGQRLELTVRASVNRPEAPAPVLQRPAPAPPAAVPVPALAAIPSSLVSAPPAQRPPAPAPVDLPPARNARPPQPVAVPAPAVPAPAVPAPAVPAPLPYNLTMPTRPPAPASEPPHDPSTAFLDLAGPGDAFRPGRAGKRAPIPERPAPAAIPRPELSPGAKLLSPVVTLVLLLLCGRLLLALPADLFARLLAPRLLAPAAASSEDPAAEPQASRLAEWLVPGDRSLAPGSLARWRHAPGTHRDSADPETPVVDEGYLKLFVLATWWVGGVVGLRLVVRQGGGFGDLCAGALAGAGAGLAVSATLGCLLLLGDAFPRLLLGLFAGSSMGPVLATLLWLALLALGYALYGLLLGCALLALGGAGRRVQALLAAPLASLARACGAFTAAEFLAPQG